MDCCNKNNCIANCEIIGFTVSTIVGIIIGYLFAVGLIPITINLITIALFMSVIGLAILVATLLFTNRINYECICKISKLLLIGSIGTLISTTISAILGVTIISLIASIFVGLSAFFFVLMIISIICLINCIIKELCKKELE